MKKFIVLFAFVLTVGGCAFQATVLEFKPFHKTEFSPRKEKAALVSDRAMQLIARGHVLIGYIDLRQNLDYCYPDSGCKTIKPEHDEDDAGQTASVKKSGYPREDELAYEAAKVGGDRISLLEEKDIQETISKQVCNGWSSYSYTVDGKTYYSTQCSSWRTVYGTLYAKIKRALVWRYEPELAASEDNILALRHAVTTLNTINNASAPKSGL